MKIEHLKADYSKWLQSAHDYYWGDGTEDMMSDGEWDMLAKQYAKTLSAFPIPIESQTWIRELLFSVYSEEARIY